MRFKTVGLIVALAIGLVMTPMPSKAQKPGKVFRIGWLSPHPYPPTVHPDFFDEFRALGWVEGKNFVLEYRRLRKIEQRSELAAELVRLKVDLIVTVLTVSTQAAKEATSTIPIVFTMVSDPLGDGLVESISRPGGNVTGICNNVIEVSGKVLQLITQAVPGASRFAYLWNPTHGRITHVALAKTQAAAEKLGVTLQSVEAREDEEIEPAFLAMTKEHAQGLVVLSDHLMHRNYRQVVDLALNNQIPMINNGPTSWAHGGALMSYTPPYPPQSPR